MKLEDLKRNIAPEAWKATDEELVAGLAMSRECYAAEMFFRGPRTHSAKRHRAAVEVYREELIRRRQNP